jgi:hypothetical protein
LKKSEIGINQMIIIILVVIIIALVIAFIVGIQTQGSGMIGAVNESMENLI